jgi:multiple antibiotic resistance protein
MSFSDFINHFVTLLVIANPLSALPVILRITQHQNLEQKRKTGRTCATAVMVIFIVVTWIGSPLLAILGIKLQSFQVAGGLILLTIAFSMLNAEESPIKLSPDEQAQKRSEMGAIVPLAMPIIAGPATMTTLIVSVNEFPGLVNQLLISASAILVALVMGTLLYFAAHLEKILGIQGVNIINRVGGLILAALAIQMLSAGLLIFFPGLGSLSHH